MSSASTIASDSELLRVFACMRSEASFEQLVKRFVDLVYSTALRRVRDEHLAEDVTQAVFLLLSQRAAKLSPDIVLAGWLYQTARYISADAIKMRTRRQKHECAAAAVNPESFGDSTDVWNELSPVLDAAMDRLPIGDRDVLLLRFFQQMDVAAVALHIGVPANTASRRIHRALGKLRGHLVARGISSPADVLGAAIATGAIQHAPPSLISTLSASGTGVSPSVLNLSHGTRSIALAIKIAALILTISMLSALVMLVHITRPSSAQAPAPRARVSSLVIPPPTAMPLSGPLEPTSPAQQQTILTAVYTLSHYTLFVQYNEWPKAIRTLVTIGRPAVPDLVAQLDRTSNDSTLRAMGFTLRAIGDPRACPALIRALARTSVLSSDCIFTIADNDLNAFMRQHELLHNPQSISYERAIRQLAGALETITHHTEGSSSTIDAQNDSPTSLDVARVRHVKFSAQWQKWWNQHQRQFVTDADLATLIAHSHEVAAIETAGIGAFGPLFPTGKPYSLGPIHDVRIHASDEAYDTAQIIDFDANRTMSMLEAFRLIPPGMKESEAPGGSSIFYRTDGAAADAFCINKILNYGKPDAKDIFTLYGNDDLIWFVDEGRWDTLESEIESGEPISLDPSGPSSDFTYRDPMTHQSDTTYHFPATFLFRTREGGAGIVQLLESEMVSRTVHIRYQMVEPHPKHYVPKPFAPLPPSMPFGVERQMTLSSVAPGALCAMDLATGQTFTAPSNLTKETFGYSLRFLHNSTANVFPMEFASSVGRREPSGLQLSHLTIIPLSGAMFDTLDPALAQVALDHWSPSDFSVLERDPQRASAAAFRTADGTTGMIQVTGVTKSPPTITFRYKLLPMPATQPAR